jgi:hypothetical protein
MGSKCPKVQPVTVMCPVAPDKVTALKTMLVKLPRGKPDSVLRKTRRTHFGRWVVIERLCDEDQKNKGSDDLTVPYLLFTANIDGDVDSYLKLLVSGSPGETHGIWSHCIGYHYDGDDAGLVAYLLGNSVRTNLLFAPYGKATVAKVNSVVNLRREFIDFAVKHDGTAAGPLQKEFLEWYDRQPAEVRC